MRGGGTGGFVRLVNDQIGATPKENYHVDVLLMADYSVYQR